MNQRPRPHGFLTIRLFVIASLLSSLAVSFFGGGSVHPAQAATTWVVTSLADTTGTLCPNASNCTVRQAMSQAASGDTITFGLSGTITLTSGGLSVTQTLTIDGSGQSVTISGNTNFTVFLINNTGNTVGNLTLKNVTVAEGYSGSGGGGVFNYGRLTIQNSTFSGNYAGGGGGGVFNYGTLTIEASTFSGNTTGGGDGGGVYNAGTLTITNSTFSGNSTAGNFGGGVENYQGGTATIQNSTLSGNTAGTSTNPGDGGGVGNAGTLYMGSNIVAGNTAISGPDIYNDPTGGGTVTSLGHNLVGDGTGSGLTNGTNGDQVGTAANPINPQLAALASNGGTTQTMAILFGSTAIAKGDCNLPNPAASVSTDQRGVGRKTPCDVGAFESVGLSSPPPTNTLTPTQTFTPTNTPTPSPTNTPLPPHIDSIGVFRSGTFYLRLHNSTGYADINVKFNPATKPYPVVGDWVGQGFDTVGELDQSNGLFSLCSANNTAMCADMSNVTTLVLGNPNDIPLSGKWTSGFTQFGVGVFRPSNGLIYLKNNLTSGYADDTMVLGIPGDTGLAGDWNGDGLDSPGVYRASNQHFYLTDQVCNCSVTGSYQLQYGVAGDSPVIGDWIGQGHDGVGLFRQSNGFTYLRNSLTTGYADIAFTYGIAGDIPVAGHWQLTYPPAPNANHVLVPPTAIPVPGNGLSD